MIVLPFNVEDETFCINIDKVVEVIPVVRIIQIAGAENYLSGLINYRGEIIPVIDMSFYLRERKSDLYLSTRIIVINTTGTTIKSNYIGLLAEKLTDTLNINQSDIKKTGIDSTDVKFLDGIIQINNQVIKHLNIDSLMLNLKEINN